MSIFQYIGAAGRPELIEFPYLISLETAKQWMVTLQQVDPELKQQWDEKQKLEREQRSQQQREEYRQKRAALFEKATKLTQTDTPLYDEDADKWFWSLDELLDDYECSGDPVPPYVWCSKPIPITRYNTQDLFEDFLEDEQYEGCYERITHEKAEAVRELDVALNNFFDAIADCHGWEPDYTKVLLLTKGGAT